MLGVPPPPAAPAAAGTRRPGPWKAPGESAPEGAEWGAIQSAVGGAVRGTLNPYVCFVAGTRVVVGVEDGDEREDAGVEQTTTQIDGVDRSASAMGARRRYVTMPIEEPVARGGGELGDGGGQFVLARDQHDPGEPAGSASEPGNAVPWWRFCWLREIGYTAPAVLWLTALAGCTLVALTAGDLAPDLMRQRIIATFLGSMTFGVIGSYLAWRVAGKSKTAANLGTMPGVLLVVAALILGRPAGSEQRPYQAARAVPSYHVPAVIHRPTTLREIIEDEMRRSATTAPPPKPVREVREDGAQTDVMPSGVR